MSESNEPKQGVNAILTDTSVTSSVAMHGYLVLNIPIPPIANQAASSRTATATPSTFLTFLFHILGGVAANSPRSRHQNHGFVMITYVNMLSAGV